ncbi:methyltransferase [Pullulanibacillus camelliae]|uniref:Methyltransferase n=1 Tax=Pullulanibacillus camelliae TaxID=1707096 RepID=A0A8J2YJQ4_9BACL|nr:class I SAM-dependent methyltransferase [Pullulanibacillus camelliae]GGE46770.1 methyltransferase [Pullulanibacillus camelliae]
MNDQKYLDFLAKLGISSAHPGGFPLTKALLDSIKPNAAEHVLDVGCGTGETSVYLAKHFKCNVVAVDKHPAMIEHAKKRAAWEQAPITLLQADVEHLPLSSEMFDKVIAESVTVFTNIEQTLQEYYRVLKPKGCLLDIEMTSDYKLRPEEIAEIKRVYGVHNVLTTEEWVEQLQQTGFKEVKVYNGLDFLQSMTELPSVPAIELSQGFDAEAFEIWLEHIKTMEKYQALNYRIYMARS